MKYDLIVVGGGPAGVMATKTAAEDGLKVLLIERKRILLRSIGPVLNLQASTSASPVPGVQ